MTIKQKAATAGVTVGISALTALIVLVQAGFINKWAWSKPTYGATPVAYECEARWVVADTSTTVVRVGKTEYQMRVRGVDAQGRAGEWSPWSESEK